MGAESGVQALLRQGIAAARGGRPEEARELLSRVLEMDPENEQAWLWMSAVVSDEERVVCLENVLAINPSSELARIGLESLLEKPADIDEEETIAPEPERPASETPSIPQRETLAATDEEAPKSGRNCVAYIALAFLAVMAFSVCGVAALLGGTMLTAGQQQAMPTTTIPAIPAETVTPIPGITFPPTFTPTPTHIPAPTHTLVIPDARIPGFPIVSEGAYDEVEGRVRELRGLESLREVQMVTFTRYRLEEYLSEWYRHEERLSDLETAEKLYQVLGLIDEDYDLVGSQIEMLREYVAGLYDSEQEEIYLVLDRYTSDLWLEVTFAHEFTHALQDQHFDLDSLDERSLTTDSRLALQALIEGDASLVMVEYAFKHLFEIPLERSDLLEAIQQVEQGEYGDAPTVVRETAWFTYEQGMVFAAALVERGGWAELNEAFRNPPQTTEQVMHPDKYFTGEAGHPPEIDDLLLVLGGGWEELSRDVLGELFIRVYLESELGSEEALMAGEGWEGDTAVLMFNEEQGRYAFVLRIGWDGEPDAAEFLSFYTTYMQRAGAGQSLIEDLHRQRWPAEDQVTFVSQEGEETLLVLTSDPETMDLILAEFPRF